MAEDATAAAAALLNLGSAWTPDAFGTLLADVMELAAFEGREAAFLDLDGPGFAETDPTFTPLEFRQQIDFLTQKRPRPTRVWTDALYGDHDRAFVIAGATDIAMLEEFQAAIIEAARSYDREAFGAEFDRIVAKYGWSYNGGRNWRVRTILETNIRTSYMAGRLRQMRDPDVVKLHPYWEYRHADTRVPENPRPEHLSFDGLVLRWDDPWWEVYFPPNGWVCSCGVHSLSPGDLRRRGKSGPDEAPAIHRRPYRDKLSGQTLQLPEGVDFGWDYMPGDNWTRGLVPSALIDHPDAFPAKEGRGAHVVQIDEAEPVSELLEKAIPFTARKMAPGQPPQDYATAFLQPFGAEIGTPRLWTDRAGTRLLISEALFQRPDGTWKANKRGHGEYAPLLAEAITDPDEIWLGVREVPIEGFPDEYELMVTRRYIRVDPETALFSLFELGRRAWGGVTAYASLNRSKPDYGYLDRQRVGKLLWKRK